MRLFIMSLFSIVSTALVRHHPCSRPTQQFTRMFTTETARTVLSSSSVHSDVKNNMANEYSTEYHTPVMYKECVDSMLSARDTVYRYKCDDDNNNRKRLILVDATLGGGGHSQALLERMEEGDLLIGCDRDPMALEEASKRLQTYIQKKMFIPHLSNFRDLASSLLNVVDQEGQKVFDEDEAKADALLMDLGVSSYQIDTADRGFSFMRSGPLDMRMNSSSGGLSAADICNCFEEKSLIEILRVFGDEPKAKKIVQSIINRRPLLTTADLFDAVAAVTPEFAKNSRRQGRTATCARVFQALRIVVNEEDTSLTEALAVAAPNVLKSGGKLVVLTYHSMEDRATKRVMRDGHEVWVYRNQPNGLIDKKAKPRKLEKDIYGNDLTYKPWKPIVKGAKAQDTEIELNPRARSATLRVAERL